MGSWRVSIVVVMVAILALAIPVSPVAAERFGGVEFPGGITSFADVVVTQTARAARPADVGARHWMSAELLGPPDYASSVNDRYMSLGEGGSVTVQFTDNALVGSNSTAADLYIFEVGGAPEATFVDISKNGTTWHRVGRVAGSTHGVDIDAFGFTANDRFSYVRLTDDVTEGGSSYPFAGADIDAVGAASTISTMPMQPGPASRGFRLRLM